MNHRFRVGILGAGGFTGQELIRILAHHPQFELVYITSSEYVGKTLAESFASLATPVFQGLKFSAHPKLIEDAPKLDAIFLATPDEVSLHWAPQFMAVGTKVVDISGAFRIRGTHTMKHVVYGLTEIHRDKIKTAAFIANPGCYPTAALLPLYVYRDHIDFSAPIIIDAKSGSSGAGGRKEKDGLGYSTVYENFRGYKTSGHQHAPEIGQEASDLSATTARIRFTPHLLPMYRGIHSTTYARPKAGTTRAELAAAEAGASHEVFLRKAESVDAVELRRVQHTNFCDYAQYFDEENGIIQIVSAIDNLMKGAAGQAVQNLNLMFGIEETTGVI